MSNSVPEQELGEGADVRLGHLERLELGEFTVAAQRGNDLAQSLESVVQTVHASAFPGVCCQSTLFHYLDRRYLGRASSRRTGRTAGRCIVSARWRRRRRAFRRPRRPRFALSLRCWDCRRLVRSSIGTDDRQGRLCRRLGSVALVRPQRRVGELAGVRLLIRRRAVLARRHDGRGTVEAEQAVVGLGRCAAVSRHPVQHGTVRLLASWTEFRQEAR